MTIYNFVKILIHNIFMISHHDKNIQSVMFIEIIAISKQILKK
jgi:hypothetical protein